MVIIAELHAYLARAAEGDASECPPEIDVIWHAALAYPQAYQEYCLQNYGVIIDHITTRPGECHAKIQGHCRARIRR